MKKVICLVMFIFSLTFLFSQNEFDSINTVLIVVDEEENGSFVTEYTPFTDGIFKAMWDREYIFFDMRLEDPIKLTSGKLEVNPYLNEAKASGADTILLVKVTYFSKKEGAGLRINAKDFYYNIYSIGGMKSIRHGRGDLQINEHIDNIEQKNAFLKNSGFEILNKIFR